MLGPLWIIPALPLAGFVILALAGARWPRRAVSFVGLASVGLSAVFSFAAAWHFVSLPRGTAIVDSVWTWFRTAGLSVGIDLRLDALSLVFVLVVSFVGFFIHLYSSEFMQRDEGYSRFFAAMNLFVGFMLILVLADNLLLLYLGWEGVGLCSYLLIGFWYKDPANGAAARKAFIVTRVGDTAFAVGLFLLFRTFGTLAIPGILSRAPEVWAPGAGLAAAAAALLLGGAVGKSAQLPLQTWLPDAMAGPTPVSALIHAATMVTAGVYLICRMHPIFDLAPRVKLVVGVIGAATLLISGLSALVQVDIKRVLAYSTISQVGYMFLAMGAGAWPAAVFHFATHAFFKSLLFLAAGVVIMALHEQHDISKMGGLRSRLPLVFWTFLAGAASLSAVPLVTAGFYSKEMILGLVWSSGPAGPWLWTAGILGALITVLYTFRVVFIVFFGEARSEVNSSPGLRLKVPLVVLAVLSMAAGFIQLPRALGNVSVFADFLRPVFGGRQNPPGRAGLELGLEIAAAAVVFVGLYLAYVFYGQGRRTAHEARKVTMAEPLRRFLLGGMGFDWLYDRLFVRPFCWAARVNRDDFVDFFFQGVAALGLALHGLLSLVQTGRLRWYARVVVVGAMIVFAVVVFL
jgi:NADH-quinone oxidoreductase subunit L